MSWEPLHSSPSVLTDRLGKSDGVEVYRWQGLAAGAKTDKLAVPGALVIYGVTTQFDLTFELFDPISGGKLTFSNETAMKRNSTASTKTAYWNHPPPWISCKNDNASEADVYVYVVRQHVKQKGR